MRLALSIIALSAVFSFAYLPSKTISLGPTIIKPCQVTQVIFTEPTLIKASDE